MLFDLRGAGRRRIVKTVYIMLAFLMGGGLVLFGIGGGGGISGGLVDAITERSGGTDDGADRFTQAGEGRARQDEGEPAGRGRLRRPRPRALPARRRRLELRSRTRAPSPRPAPPSSPPPAPPGSSTSRSIRRSPTTASPASWSRPSARSTSPTRRPTAQEVITDARPTASTFTQLAIFAYQAGQTRKGDLAKDKALELTDPDMREALKGQLEQAKQSAAGAAAAADPSATP